MILETLGVFGRGSFRSQFFLETFSNRLFGKEVLKQRLHIVWNHFTNTQGFSTTFQNMRFLKIGLINEEGWVAKTFGIRVEIRASFEIKTFWKLLLFENEFSTPFETKLFSDLLFVNLLKIKVDLEKSKNHLLSKSFRGFWNHFRGCFRNERGSQLSGGSILNMHGWKLKSILKWTSKNMTFRLDMSNWWLESLV